MDATGRTWPWRGDAEWTMRVTTADGDAPRSGFDGLDERALIRACVERQPGAFDELVARHRRPVYQLCYRFLDNHEDATDAAQEVFLRAFRGLERFKGESSLGTWLYRIGVNLCLNRRASHQPPTESLDDRDLVESQAPDAMSRLLADERAARVRAAIARLPERQRAALVLRVFQELPHQQIAAILGSSEGAVKANFFHALRNLRKLLAGESI
jgi:RNA polymerase sigma-70 factor, ECF subfamily